MKLLALNFLLFCSLFNLVHLAIMVDKPGCGHTRHVSQEPQGHLVEVEPKETWAARGKLGPRDHVVLTERKEQRESLGSRVPPDKKESEGTKATVERHDWLHTWTGRSAHGEKSGGVRTTIAKHHGRYSKFDHLCQDDVEWTSRLRSEYSLITL